MVPRMVVVHWTGGHSLKAAWKNFNRTKLAGRPFLQKHGKVNVAAHYLVDRDGTAYRLMPDDLMGRHVIGLNHCSIGIENIGNNDLTGKQVKANARLVEYLAKKHDSIEYLIGHYEYLRFEGSPLFIEKFPGYRTKKKDPGKEFMAGLRALLLEKGIDLASEPPS
jgi:N-acetyl-anhydromuramyl-L-alanine amidase AmpD